RPGAGDAVERDEGRARVRRGPVARLEVDPEGRVPAVGDLDFLDCGGAVRRWREKLVGEIRADPARVSPVDSLAFREQLLAPCCALRVVERELDREAQVGAALALDRDGVAQA